LADSSQPKLEFATKLEESVYLRVTRFYFHLHNDMDVPDDDGKELHNLEAAHAHAIRMARFEVSEAVVRDGRIVQTTSTLRTGTALFSQLSLSATQSKSKTVELRTN
jgi:hypothetical protein